MQYNIYQIPSQTRVPDSFIGKNARNILIVLQKEAYQAHTGLLRKIMQSVDLDLTEDCVVFPFEENEYLPFSRIREAHNIQLVLMFGDCAKVIGIQARTPGNSVFPFAQAQFLRTYPLPELTSDQHKKRLLWNALKKMFQPA